MPAVRTRKEDNYMEIKCLTQDFPQGKRVYDADGVAPSLMHTASTMRSQAIMVRGGGSGVNAEKDVCCIASTQTNAERMMNTAPTLSRDKDRTIVGYNSFCLAGNFVDRNTNQNGSGVRENASFTLNTQDRHAVAYDARNSRLNGTVSGTLQAKESGGWSLNYINPVIQPDVPRLPEWVVRRLLPMECGRLQGFPDGWGKIAPLTDAEEIQFWREVYLRNCKIKGQKPKKIIARADGARSDAAVKRWHDELHSPSAEYSMWGNGMALPNALFFVQNAFRELGKSAAEVKLGSLFDGSGTMPLCAVMCGGRAVWASEVEPYPIAVTKTHLPEMQHIGSITDIKGSRIEPVDIITFGSPCQDLSIAGKRKGLGGDQSCLFYEAIRVIREMLSATGGRYPRFVIWENVPGALSSHGGKDFEIVLNELLHLRDFAGGGTDKPIRQHGRWAKRASYGTVAYRIVNAQYWGIPHRRRRIYAVCDTRGESATMVAFERNGAEWHFRPRLPEGGQTVACLAPDCYSWHDRMVAAGKPLRGGGERAYTLKIRQGCEGGGKGPLVQTELSATLATHQDQSLIQRAAGFDLGNSGGIAYSEECSPTLMTGAGGNKTAVVQDQRLMESLVLNDQGGKNMDVSVNVTGTLRAQTHGHLPVVFQKSEDEENET